MKTLTLLLVLPLASLCAQIRPDFLLADSAAQVNLTYALDGKLHAAWLNIRDTQIVYTNYDGMFNSINPIVGISNTPFPSGVIVTASSRTVLVSWWCQPVPPIGVWNVYGQLLDSDGDTVGANFRIDEGYISRLQDAAFLNDTTFVVIWSGSPDAYHGMYGRLGTNTNGMTGNEIHLSDDRPLTEGTRGKVAANWFNGDFMVAWVEAASQAGKSRVLGRIFNQTGLPKTSSEIMIVDTLYDYLWSVDIQGNSNGQYIIVWSELRDTSWYIKLKRVDENGSQVGMVETVNPDGKALPYASLDVAVDTNGDFLVVWEQTENVWSRIYGQRYSADGTAIGTNFRVSVKPDTTEHYFPSIALNGKKIYVAWIGAYEASNILPQVWAKVLDFDNPATSIVLPPVSMPHMLSLFYNYPNPFNPSTQIRYSIKDAGYVSLKVYDLLGREVAVLVNEDKQPGTYSVEWNARHFPSGMYFSRLESGGKAITQKLLLVR